MADPVTVVAGPGDDGRRVDAVLGDRLGSRTKAQALIAAGRVSVGGQAVQKRHIIAAGDRLVYEPETEVEAPAIVESPDPTVAIVFEDESIIVVDKPAGMVVHPAPGHPQGTLVQLLSDRTAGGEGWRAGLVHRLDRDTSGLLVLAKTDAAHAELKQQLQSRAMERVYSALVEGRPPSRSGTIDAPIGRDRRVRTRHSTDTATAREARTHFEVVEMLGRFTLLAVTLETGRTHQIRVHLEAIGHPVVGDPVYGRGGLLGLDRQFLHAARLSFAHPRSGEPLRFTSQLPGDLAEALVRARSHTRS